MYFRHEKPRKGQLEFMHDWREAFEHGEIMLAEAPCGIGKTDAAISPVIAEAPILFLTPKHSQHILAYKVATELDKKFGLGLSIVDIVGRRRLCPKIQESDNESFQILCQYLREHGQCEYYTNPMPPLRRHVSPWDISGEFCHYEYILKHLDRADVVIADYNFFFSPFLRPTFLKRLRRDISELVIIVDEAHNLPPRALSYMSRSLSVRTVRAAEKEWRMMKNEDLDIAATFAEFVAEEREVKEEEFYNLIENWPSVDDLIDVGEEFVKQEQRRSHLLSLAGFIEFWPIGRSARYVKGRTLFKKAVDPSEITRPLNEARAALLMSATFSPLEMYEAIMDLRGRKRKYASPFPAAHKLQIVYPGLTTKYEMRNEEMFSLAGKLVDAVFEAMPRNLLVFVPSFKFLDRLRSYISQRPLYIQPERMKPQYLTHLKEALSEDSSIVLAVAGGSLSEGVDFPGYFSGIIILGVPFEEPTPETKERIAFYEEKFGKGYEYGYLYPALSRALQSAGRAIRSEKDKAVIIFADRRYTNRKIYEIIGGGVVSKDPIPFIEAFFDRAYR